MPIKPGSVKVRNISGKGFCVVDADSGDPINGGNGSCHTDRADAVKQLRAIYASAGKNFAEVDSLVGIKNFADLVNEAGAGEPVWIQAFPFGHWPHPQYTDTTITHERAERMVKNFKENVRRQEIGTDFEHGMDTSKGAKASGWIKSAELRDDGVWLAVDFTPTARKEIADGEWKYFSATMLDAWHDSELDIVYEDVIIGGGLTNKPWMKDRVPLNFSEVVNPDEGDSGLRFKKGSDDEFLVSEDGGETWRAPIKNEVAEWEHSEPGTGPTPRTDEDDRSGDKDGSGSRRDSPPPAFEDNKEGSEVKLSKESLEALGLPEDATDEQVNGAIVKMYGEFKPLKDAALKDDRQKKFAEDYPEEYAEMQKNKEIRLTNEAKEFSEKYERITIGEGDEATKSTRGPSALALNKIQETHKQFSEGNAADGMKLFGEALDLILSDKGIVDYGESGSSRSDDKDPVPSDAREAGKQFAEEVKKTQTEAGGPEKMSWGDAVAATAKANPELAKKYSETRK